MLANLFLLPDMVISKMSSSLLTYLKIFFLVCALEKEMATHSSVLAWKIPGMEEPGGLPSMGVTQSQTQLFQPLHSFPP